MMQVRTLEIPAVKELIAPSHVDARGCLTVSFARDAMQAVAPGLDWVQDNQTRSTRAFTLRGLHYQAPPFAQAKLVRVLKGRILDVAVDIRLGSPTYRRFVARQLSAESGNQLFVPIGFAHGFLTLEPDTEVFYKLSAPYSAPHARAIHHRDPAIGVNWPLAGHAPFLSDADRDAQNLTEAATPFVFAGDAS